MFCEMCGKQLPDDALFCYSCGKPTSNATPNVSAPVNKTPAGRGFAVIAVFVFIFLVLLLILPKTKERTASSTHAETAAPPRPVPAAISIPHDQKLFSGSVAVNADNMYYLTFTVDRRMKNVRVTGHFQASGGMRNDIQVVVCSDEDYINLRNGHPARVFYNSGKTTIGDIDVSLPEGEGKYVLVFSNAFSAVSGKTVNGQAVLHYDTLF